MTTASTITDTSTAPPVAPMARTNASSRVRWETTIA